MPARTRTLSAFRHLDPGGCDGVHPERIVHVNVNRALGEGQRLLRPSGLQSIGEPARFPLEALLDASSALPFLCYYASMHSATATCQASFSPSRWAERLWRRAARSAC